jgi:hypothetical protein
MIPGHLSLHCIAFGVRFELTTDDDDVLAMMLERAPLGTEAFVRAFAGERQFSVLRQGSEGYRMAAGDEMVAESGELQAVLDLLGRDLMVHVADNAPDRVFLHAGVVGWQGNALVLPGTSFAGKTTLVAELVRAGATYYSDEYAVVDEQGFVHPYARALQMRQGSGVAQTSVAVERLDGRAGADPLPVARVVFTEYVEGGLWSPQPVSAGNAVLEMLRHAIPVQRTPARVMTTLAKMMEAATAWRTMRGEASEAAKFLLGAMSSNEACE